MCKPNRGPGRFFAFFRHRVRARKPNSVALRATVREPCRRPGSISLFSRHKVRARKPNSVALQATVREPCRRPGSISLFSRHKVRARKPNPLALRAAVREPLPPCRSPGRLQIPLFWGLIDRIHFLYGFIRYETPAAMLSSCEGSLPGLHMRTGTALPFP